MASTSPNLALYKTQGAAFLMIKIQPLNSADALVERWSRRLKHVVGAFSIVMLLAACGGGGDSSPTVPGAGVARTTARALTLASDTPRYVAIAVEGAEFFTDISSTIRYGEGVNWIELVVTGAGLCTNEFFGNDPSFGVVKRCELVVVVAPPTEDGWVQIAVESEAFQVDAPQAVRYGEGTRWVERLVDREGHCTNEFFESDPAFGVVKSCKVRQAPAVPTAPTIVSAPLNRTVQAGQSGSFVVAASGMGPLSYQWFKNGVAIAGANATDVMVLADPVDVGGSYEITVEVGNAQGNVRSVPAVMTIADIPSSPGGTLVSAIEGGTVDGDNGTSLSVEPGALSGDSVIALVSESVAPGSMPAGATALSDIVEITPAGLTFAKPVSVIVSVNQDVPNGTALAVLYLDAGNNVLAPGRKAALSTGKVSKKGGRPTASGIALPTSLACQDRQFVDSGSKFTLTGIAAAVRTVVVAVPESMCASIAAPTQGAVPLDTVEACSVDSQFGFVGTRAPAGLSDDESSLVNRHVDCRASAAVSQQSIDVDMVKAADGTLKQIASASAALGTTESVQVGLVTYGFQVSTFGSSGALGKTLKYRARVTSFDANTGYDGPNKSPKILLRPRLESNCNAVPADGFPAPASANCRYGTPKEIALAVTGNTWSQWQDLPVGFEWSQAQGSPFDMAFFNVDLGAFDVRIEGTDASFKRPGGQPVQTAATGLGVLPTLRCDKGLAQKGNSGCVFPQAAAVYVLKTSDFQVKEAAEHVAEAQANGSPGAFGLSAGTRAFADSFSVGKGLQRFKNARDVGSPNNTAACKGQNALINLRPPKSSNTCSPNQAGCECDEYPFNSTFQGAAYASESTSVKWINGKQNNRGGGGKLAGFYKTERLLDLADYPVDNVTPPVSGGSSDYFWVLVP